MVKVSPAGRRSTKADSAILRQPVLEAGSDRSSARAREDYVKAIYQVGIRGPVRAADVARRLKVSAVSVSKAKRQLERDGLLEPAQASLILTARGKELAVGMVRRHRLIETFLHDFLGISLERIHAEAERIEHVISDDIADRLAKMLRYPARDPHGHVIPYNLNGQVGPVIPRLTSVAAGSTLRVHSLDDRDERIVRVLADTGVLPGVQARVLDIDAGSVRLRLGERDVALTAAQADTVHVVMLEP